MAFQRKRCSIKTKFKNYFSLTDVLKKSGLIRLTLSVILKCTGCLLLPHEKERDFTNQHRLLLSASHLSLESFGAPVAATQKMDLPVLAHSGMGIYCGPLLNYTSPKGAPF